MYSSNQLQIKYTKGVITLTKSVFLTKKADIGCKNLFTDKQNHLVYFDKKNDECAFQFLNFTKKNT